MANKWVTHDHSNYPPGGPVSASYLADAGEFNQNYEDICDAVGARYVRGVACENKNSTSTTCEIWLQADGGARDVCDDGWYALIYYGTSNVWETTVSVSGSDCYVVFGDGQLKNPEASGVSDYSATAFIDGLHVILFPKKMMLPADWLITTEGADGGLSSGDIYHADELLSDFIADVKVRLDTICKTTGGLEVGVVDSTSIAGDVAVKFDSSVNLLAGGSLEHYGDQHNLLFGVETYGETGTYSIEEAGEPPTNTDGSRRAQKVFAPGSNIGILLPISPHFEGAVLADKEVSATFRVKADVANSLDVGFWVDDVIYTDAPTVGAGGWESVTITKTISSSAKVVKALIRSNTENVTFIVARAQMNLGDKCFGFSISPYEDAARILMDTTQDNLFYNGGFEHWTLTEGTDPPDGWFAIEGATFANPAVTNVGACTGNKSCEATLGANDGMGQYLGLVTDVTYTGGCVNESILVGLVRGAKVCASVDIMYDATSSGKITLVLGDRVDATTSEETTFDVEPLQNEMRRFTIYKDIQVGAKQVYFKILNDEAAAKVVTVDNAMLHVGEFPLMFKPSAGWREMRWDFSDETAMLNEHMDALGIQGGKYPMPQEAAGYLMLKAAVRCLTKPGVGGNPTIYQLCVDAASFNGISVEIPDDEFYGDNHITDYNDANDQCEQYLTAPECTQINGGETEAGNVIFSVWGYYYAP